MFERRLDMSIGWRKRWLHDGKSRYWNQIMWMRGEDKIEVLNHLARCSFAIGAEENKRRLRKANSDNGTEGDNQLSGNRRKNQKKLEACGWGWNAEEKNKAESHWIRQTGPSFKRIISFKPSARRPKHASKPWCTKTECRQREPPFFFAVKKKIGINSK